ncbi:hypothetical protein D9M70_329050 [compost metagenome]
MQGGGKAGIDSGKFFDGQAVLHEAEADTAILFGDVHAEKAEFGDSIQFRPRPGARAVALGGSRRDHFLGHLAGGIADHDFLFAQERCRCIAHCLPRLSGGSSTDTAALLRGLIRGGAIRPLATEGRRFVHTYSMR